MPRSSNGRAAPLHGADGSSILSRGTSFVSRYSLVRLKAPALGAGDREFESHFRDQYAGMVLMVTRDLAKV